MATNLRPVSAIDRLLARDLSRRSLVQGAAASALVAGLGGMLRFAPAAAQDATPATGSPAPAHRVNVGQIEVIVLDDGTFPGPASLFAANAPEAALAEVMAGLGLTLEEPLLLGVHPLLVETGGQRVLLDTGSGAAAKGTLLAALAAEGIAPEEIDVVLISHMHSDHFGGALDAAGALVFPNARHLIDSVEYDFWAAGPTLDELVIPEEVKPMFLEPVQAALQGLTGSLEMIAPGDEIAPGLTAVDARGHTPGHLAVELSSEGETALHIVDAAHVPAIHLTHPDWFMVADNWPAWSVTSRKAIFDRAAAEDLLVFSYHFPFPGVGRVAKDEIGWIWTPEA